jgi:hypothetical protein
MANKTYTVRVPTGAPDITSDAAAQWLEGYLAAPAELAADPGAGERSLRLSLDKENVEQGAGAAGVPEATFLRRLIATRVRVPQEEKTEEREEKAEARLKSPVLRGPLKLRPEQVRPVVHLFEAGQSYVIRQAFRVPPHPATLQAAAFSEEEREQLSVAGCEALNRRAPRALVENIDLVGLVTTILAIESHKIEAVQAVAESYHQARQQAQSAAQAPSAQSQPAGGQS